VRLHTVMLPIRERRQSSDRRYHTCLPGGKHSGNRVERASAHARQHAAQQGPAVSASISCKRLSSHLPGGTLAPGWSVRVRTRTVMLHGKERQQKDAFYQSPAGETHNSRRKVAIALGLMSTDDTT